MAKNITGHKNATGPWFQGSEEQRNRVYPLPVVLILELSMALGAR